MEFTTLRKHFSATFYMTTFLLVILIPLFVLLIANQRMLIEGKDLRYQSYLLADELRQSSDDLTRLVRTYVVTGDPKYEQQFWNVLAIRNGKLPRPQHYERIYWDLMAVGIQPRPAGEAISLQKLMEKAGFTEEEFALLHKAHENSNKLTELENIAMHMVKGVFQDANGQFTVHGEPDLEMARQLVYGEVYHQAKAGIMQPIDEFLKHLDERTTTQANAFVDRSYIYLYTSIVFIVVFICALFTLNILSFRGVNHLKQSERLLQQQKEELHIKNQLLETEVVARQQIEETLRENEERFRAIFESTTDCVIVLDKDYIYLYANQAALDYIHATHEQLVGQTVADIFTGAPEYAQAWMERIDHIFSTGEAMRVEDTLTLGEMVAYSESIVVPLKNVQNQVFAIGLIYRDVTDRKHAEEALRASEERFQLAMQATNDGLWDWNLETNEIYFSARWKEIIGYEDQEIANLLDEFGKRVHPEDIQEVWDRINAYLEKRSPHYDTTFRMLHKQGHYVWILTQGMATWNEQGKPYRMLGTHTDITKQKQAELSLQQALNDLSQFKTTLDMTLDAIFMIDTETLKFIYVNQGFINQVGYSQVELLQMQIGAIKPSFDEKKFRGLLTAFIEGEMLAQTYETVYQHKAGHLIPVEVSIQYIQVNNKQTQVFLIISRDITDRKQAEEQLVQTSQRLNAILESTSDSICAMDKEYRFLAFNTAHCKRVKQVFGQEPQIGCSALDMMPEQDRAKARREIDRALAGESFIVEEIYGSEALYRSYYELVYNPILDENQVPIGITLFIREITERKRAEEQLIQTNLRMNAILESTNDAICAYDIHFHTTAFNSSYYQTYQQAFGFEPQIGDYGLGALWEHNKTKALDEHHRLKRAMAGESFIVEDAYGDGENRIYFELSYNPIQNDNQDITGVTLFIRNITERKHAEKLLAQASIRNKAVLESTRDAICAIDRNYRFMAFNTAYEQAVKHVYGKEVQLGGHILDIFTVEIDKEHAVQVIERAFNQGNRIRFIA